MTRAKVNFKTSQVIHLKGKSAKLFIYIMNIYIYYAILSIIFPEITAVVF